MSRGENAFLYMQIAEKIHTEIKEEHYPPGLRIPSEFELSSEYNVSRITIRKATDTLVKQGVLVRIQGKGTFVAKHSNYIYRDYPYMDFTSSCNLSGRKPSTKMLSYSLVSSSRKQAAFFQLKENDLLIRLFRLRIADQIPVILETNYFPASFSFLGSEHLQDSLTQILIDHGWYPAHGKSQTSICFLNEEEAELLQVPVNTAALYVYNEIMDENNTPFLISKQIIRSDQYRLVQKH